MAAAEAQAKGAEWSTRDSLYPTGQEALRLVIFQKFTCVTSSGEISEKTLPAHDTTEYLPVWSVYADPLFRFVRH